MHNFIYNHREIDYYSEKLWKELHIEPVIKDCPIQNWISHSTFLEDYELDYGKDTMTVFEQFIGFEKGTEDEDSYEENGLDGVFNFLKKWDRTIKENVESLLANHTCDAKNYELQQNMILAFEAPIKKNHPRAYVALLMEYCNLFYQKVLEKDLPLPLVKDYLAYLSVLAPHHAESAWQALSLEGSVFLISWPTCSQDFLMSHNIVIPIQINGKTKAELTIPSNASRDEVYEAALQILEKQNQLNEKNLREARFIYVEGKIVNFICPL